MADQRVNINIGSSYNGSGMTRALGAVNTMSSNAKRAAGAVGQLAGAFDGLGGSAAKSINAVASGLGAIATGGVFGAIIFGVTTVISLFQKWKDEGDSLDKMKSRLDGIKESTEKLTSGVSSGISKIDKYTAAVDKLTNAHLRLAAAQADAKKAAINNELENMPTGGSGEDIANQIMANAEASRKITQIDADTAKGQADAKVAGAENKIKALTDKMKLLDDSIDKLRASLGGYDHELDKAKLLLYVRQERGAGKDEIDEAKDQIKAAEKARNEFVAKTFNPTMQQRNDVVAELNTANVERQAAEQERQNVIAENDKKIALAQRSYESSTAMAAEARNKEAMEAEQLMHEQRAYALNIQHLSNRQKELEDATDELKNAEQYYANKLKAARVAQMQLANVNNGGLWNPNGATPGRRRSGASANNADNEGNWGTFAKPEGWEQRYFQTHADEARAKGIVPGLTKKEQQEYDRLADKMVEGGRNALSEKDRKRWDELKAKNPEDQAAEAEKAAAKAKEQRDTLKDKVEGLKNSVDTIKTQLDRLGLK